MTAPCRSGASAGNAHQSSLLEVTYVGHACILVEIGGVRILMDPWLCGASQYHGWWHVPPLTLSVRDLLPLDYIMISHVHDDHFHLPSLEQLPKSATAIIPYSVDPWMAQTLRQMGFSNVMELEHERPYALRGKVQVTNYQCGRIDSAYWLTCGHEAVLNLNDCPISTAWARAWIRRHPRPDVALSAFSYASPYPVCYNIEGREKMETIQTARGRVLEQFAKTMSILQPRYAVPFATQFGFLAPDQLWMNTHTPTPHQALDALRAHDATVRGVVLNPGDQLSPVEGPRQRGSTFDWANRDEALAAVARHRADEVRQAIADEPRPPEQFFEQFCQYFESLLRKNWVMRRRIGVPVAFVLDGRPERWIVDCRRHSNVVTRSADGRSPIEIHVPSSVLFAAVDGRIHWEVLYLSNRLQVHVPLSLLDREWSFWRMLFNFPGGILQDRLQFFTARGRRILWSRRREITQLVCERIMTSFGSQREPYREV